ncbi:MAG TPA: membrane protein insertion efficiency factor YidD [bacterium]|nr:membrane protein insertion efficiency factor YidD [bacterium]
MGLDERKPGWPARLLMKLVRGYQLALSPYLGRNCRFTPTCSNYALDALRLHSLPRALVLTVWRILRCNPFVPGGYDPVPPPKQKGR